MSGTIRYLYSSFGKWRQDTCYITEEIVIYLQNETLVEYPERWQGRPQLKRNSD